MVQFPVCQPCNHVTKAAAKWFGECEQLGSYWARRLHIPDSQRVAAHENQKQSLKLWKALRALNSIAELGLAFSIRLMSDAYTTMVVAILELKISGHLFFD